MITNSIGRPPAKRMKTTDLSTRKKKNSVDKNVKKLDGIIRRHKNGRFKAKRRKTPVASTTFDKKDTKHVIQQRRKDNTSTSVKIKQPATSLKKSSTVSTILGNVSSQKMIGDCWMVASKETQNSDLKLCLQKKGSNGKLTPHPPSVKSRKRHNSEEGSNQSIDSQQVSEVRCHQPLESQQVSEIGCNQPLEFQQISGGGSDHQPFESRVTEDCNMQNPVNLVNVTRKKVSKRRKLRLAYKSRQSHANNVADQHISQDQLTTEEKSKLPKKRKISQRKRNVKTANVKTEDESAVENLMLDMYVKTDDISNCSVRISDFMVQNKQEYLSRDDSSDNVVIETNSSCGDVEMLLPECITYLQNQEPPNSIMESGEPSQNEEILEDSTFDIGSLNNDDFNSLLNTETFKECVETGFCDREYSCQIYPEEGEVDKLEHLNETTEDCNNIHERDSTLVRDQQMYDGLENVLVTNIIICPSDMYILDDVDGKTEPHSEEVQFLTLDNEETCGTVENIDSRRNGKNIDCEIDETKKQNFYQDALFEHTTNNSIKKNDVPKNTDCQKLDLEECSFDETTIALDENQVNQDGYVYSEINQDIMKDQDSVCMNVNIESCDLENNVHENYTRKKVIDNSIYEEAREDKTVLEEIGPRDCNPVDNLCTLEDSGDIQKYVKTDETSQTVDKNNDNESDSVTVNEDSFTSKFLTSPCKLYSLFLLQDYSSEESDNEPTEETVILNEDDENDNDGSASSDSDGTENGKDTDKTESVGESVCQSPACKKQNDRDSEDCDRLSLYCDSSDFFSSDNDEKSAQRENIAKKKSSLDTNSDRNVKNLNEPTQKQTSHTDSASAAASSLTRQESAQTKQAVTLQNQTSRARRVIDIQAKHLGSQPVKTVGYALSSNDVKYPLLNYTPRHAFPDYYSYTYPGKYMLEKCCKASELCVQLRNPKLPLSYPQRECMRNVVSPREEYIKVRFSFYSIFVSINGTPLAANPGGSQFYIYNFRTPTATSLCNLTIV
ncbi:uncharacterized protein [Antedon mediterranea]|uniref:uncharacterized protein n=1 Tax=Antedon mediterranea TaxID=105859 RepID=UPI003AF7240C